MIHLIVQYYAESRHDRKWELDYCLRKNLADDRIACVHDLQSTAAAPDDVRSHPKYVQSDPSDWLTFERAFQYANEKLAGQFVALTNLDVFLADEFPVNKLSTMAPNVVLALSRWEYDPESHRTWLDPTFAKFEMAFSQDMWVFRSPIHVENCDFKLGVLGCDHAIAHRLHTHNYVPVNDCLRFKICHLDRCRGKSGADGLEFHKRRPQIQSFPGKEGRMLVPMLREEISLDEAARRLGMGQFATYRALLDIWNSNMRLSSLDEPPPE